MKTKAIITAAFSLLTVPLFATNPPPGGSCSGEKKCESSDSSSTGSQSSSTKSLDWYLNTGLVKFGPRNNFLASSREGALEGSRHGAQPRTLDAIISTNYPSTPQYRLQMRLEFAVDKITAALADPAILGYNHDAGGEVIELNGFVNQVLTDDALTHVDKLASGDGFRIRVWHRSGFALNKTGNLYDIPTTTPLTDITFKNPDHPTDNGRLDITTVENKGASTHTTTKRYTQTTSPDALTTESFAGASASGTPFRREIITYTARGSKPWDLPSSENNGKPQWTPLEPWEPWLKPNTTKKPTKTSPPPSRAEKKEPAAKPPTPRPSARQKQPPPPTPTSTPPPTKPSTAA